MKRQCAWCLRLMNNAGEHLSPGPLPKLYDATHGICAVCGKRWMEQATGSEDVDDTYTQLRSNIVEHLTHSLTEYTTPAGAC